MPLLLFLCRALLSGVGCPKLKAWLRVSSLCKTIHCHVLFFVRFRTFREKIAGLFIPEDLLKDVFPTSSSIWERGFRLKTLYDFLPCPCSFAMSFWLFPPQHLTFWVIQQVLNKQPCHPYMFLSCFALPSWCAKTSVDKGRVVFHHFSHSSVKSIVICKSHCAFVPLRSSFGLALGSDTSGLFSRNFIKRFLSGILCSCFVSGLFERFHGCLFGCLPIFNFERT